jgi:hypothetical protein
MRKLSSSSSNKEAVIALHYNELISQSVNKTKAAWNVIKSLTNK